MTSALRIKDLRIVHLGKKASAVPKLVSASTEAEIALMQQRKGSHWIIEQYTQSGWRLVWATSSLAKAQRYINNRAVGSVRQQPTENHGTK